MTPPAAPPPHPPRDPAGEGEFVNPHVAAMGAEALARAVEVFRSSTAPRIVEFRGVVGGAQAPDGEVFFGLWLLQADADLRSRTGVSVLDLDGKWGWRSAYDDGEAPGAAGIRALAAHPKWGYLVTSFTTEFDPDTDED